MTPDDTSMPDGGSPPEALFFLRAESSEKADVGRESLLSLAA